MPRVRVCPGTGGSRLARTVGSHGAPAPLKSAPLKSAPPERFRIRRFGSIVDGRHALKIIDEEKEKAANNLALYEQTKRLLEDTRAELDDMTAQARAAAALAEENARIAAENGDQAAAWKHKAISTNIKSSLKSTMSAKKMSIVEGKGRQLLWGKAMSSQRDVMAKKRLEAAQWREMAISQRVTHERQARLAAEAAKEAATAAKKAMERAREAEHKWRALRLPETPKQKQVRDRCVTDA